MSCPLVVFLPLLSSFTVCCFILTLLWLNNLHFAILGFQKQNVSTTRIAIPLVVTLVIWWQLTIFVHRLLYGLHWRSMMTLWHLLCCVYFSGRQIHAVPLLSHSQVSTFGQSMPLCFSSVVCLRTYCLINVTPIPSNGQYICHILSVTRLFIILSNEGTSPIGASESNSDTSQGSVSNFF